MKPQTTTDVEVLLSETVGDVRTLNRYVRIYKEKGKPNALVKPKQRIPYITWQLMHDRIKQLGGRWSKKEGQWIVPLEKGMEERP